MDFNKVKKRVIIHFMCFSFLSISLNPNRANWWFIQTFSIFWCTLHCSNSTEGIMEWFLCSAFLLYMGTQLASFTQELFSVLFLCKCFLSNIRTYSDSVGCIGEQPPQGYFACRLDQTTNFLISWWPALLPEQQSPH